MNVTAPTTVRICNTSADKLPLCFVCLCFSGFNVKTYLRNSKDFGLKFDLAAAPSNCARASKTNTIHSNYYQHDGNDVVLAIVSRLPRHGTEFASSTSTDFGGFWLLYSPGIVIHGCVEFQIRLCCKCGHEHGGKSMGKSPDSHWFRGWSTCLWAHTKYSVCVICQEPEEITHSKCMRTVVMSVFVMDVENIRWLALFVYYGMYVIWQLWSESLVRTLVKYQVCWVEPCRFEIRRLWPSWWTITFCSHFCSGFFHENVQENERILDFGENFHGFCTEWQRKTYDSARITVQSVHETSTPNSWHMDSRPTSHRTPYAPTFSPKRFSCVSHERGLLRRKL